MTKLLICAALILTFTLEAARPVIVIKDWKTARILPSEYFDITSVNRKAGYLTAITGDRGLEWLKGKRIPYEYLYRDVEELYAKYRFRATPGNRYHTYEKVVQELNDYAKNYPQIARLEVIGQSVEKRDILAIRIGGSRGLEETKPAVLFMGAHHAREWISVEVPMAIIDRLLTLYGKDAEITKLVDSRKVWVVPMQNPDGVTHCQTKEDWRKNRRDNKDGSFGVDTNRNYPVEWGNGASTSPWSDTYQGPEIFSEPENQTIRDFVKREKFVTSISFHSHGEEILYPWSYTSDIKAPDFELLSDLAQGMAAINGYSPIQSADLYPCGGESDDWLYRDNKCLSFTIELASDFIPAESEVDSICLKNTDAALYLLKRAGNLWPVLKHQPCGSTTDNVGPYIVKATLDLQHNPNFSVQSFVLSYKAGNEMSFSETSFTDTGSGAYEARIPGQEFGKTVEYFITLNSSTRLPESGTYNFKIERTNRLVVDDDDGKNYEKYVAETLAAEGLSYTLYDLKMQGSPGGEFLRGFTEVIWLCGDDSGKTLTEEDQRALGGYLDQGGSLFLTGQDIGYNIKSSDFYKKYLHASYIDDNAKLSHVSGDFAGVMQLSMDISGGDGAGNQRYPDVVDAVDGGVVFLHYDGQPTAKFTAADYGGSKFSEIAQNDRRGRAGESKGAAVLFEGKYKVIYLGFGFEGIGSVEQRRSFLKASLEWLLPATHQKIRSLLSLYDSKPNPRKDLIEYRRLTGAARGLEDLIITDLESDRSLIPVALKTLSNSRNRVAKGLAGRIRELQKNK
ncbi:MAG: M14 family metallopeptidase [Candidatus Wallbacteria bacterium]|nr:M14 family metallopeptidase [Candidatus Wallbacteria bacterium]